MDSPLALLGVFYVLEGATLGGQILSKHFMQKFALSWNEGCALFLSYGPDVGRPLAFLLCSFDFDSSPEDNPVIVESAMHTFDCLGKWLLWEHWPLS